MNNLNIEKEFLTSVKGDITVLATECDSLLHELNMVTSGNVAHFKGRFKFSINFFKELVTQLNTKIDNIN